MRSFSSPDIEHITGLKTNTLHYYLQRGAFTPDVQPAKGRGSHRRFSARNLLEACLLKFLMDLGLPRRFILDFFDGIHETYRSGVLDPEAIASSSGEMIIIFYPGMGDKPFFRILTLNESSGDIGTPLLDRPGAMLVNVSWIVRHLVVPRMEPGEPAATNRT